MFDVAIAGGGLAGLSLARQLSQEAPHLRVLLVDKHTHPVREAAFKVGESTVELGAHYFQVVLGLDAHLRDDHLEKFGIRYFFPQGDNRDLRRRFELGPSNRPQVPAFQIDRGRLENMLFRLNREAGIETVDASSVTSITLGDPAHHISVATPSGPREVGARWLVDASGRAGLLRHQLGLTRPVPHKASAVWFRVKARLNVDDWADAPEWTARVPTRQRWLSTNHLMGRGYWVWLIPLGSGSTSVGIVADASLHPFSSFNTFERAVTWLRRFEPQCADVVDAHRHLVEDVLALKDYAYGCARVFSPDRWVLAGEAGLFTDPFYSPGSDFIAIGNDCTTDLIVRERRGEDVRERAEKFNATYLRLFDAFLRLYDGQYALMGNAQVMTAKAAWDNGCYWAITGLLFFQRRYRDPAFIDSIEPLMRRFLVLHARMQALLNAWDRATLAVEYVDGWTNVMHVDFLRRLQGELAQPRLDDETLRHKLNENLALLERFARSLQALAAEHDHELARFVAPSQTPEELVDITPLELRRLAAVSSHRSAVSC